MAELVDHFTVMWLLWIGAFVAIEGKSIVRKDKNDTLSEHVWRWFNIKGAEKRSWYTGKRLFLVAFLGWLLAHLGFGIL